VNRIFTGGFSELSCYVFELMNSYGDRGTMGVERIRDDRRYGLNIAIEMAVGDTFR